MDNLPDLPEKGRYRLRYRSTKCLNCDHPLDVSDRFCPNCSQANSTKKLSLKDFFDEFFASFISYDSKLLKTLGALLLRPGKITRDYIDGKRISYTNPFRFLLSLAIIYFLMVNFSGNFAEWDRYGMKKDRDLLENINGIDLDYSTENGTEITSAIDSVKNIMDYDTFKRQSEVTDSLILNDATKYFATIGADGSESAFSKKRTFFRTLLRKDSIYDFNDAVTKYEVPQTFVNRSAFNISSGLLVFQTRPGSFVTALVSKLPFAVFFFLPVFALFIWLAYIRKSYSYTDHLIFSFHNMALLLILLIISDLIDSIFAVESSWVFVIIFSVYLFQAMRKFYGQGIFKTIVKYLSLNAVFFMLALFAMLILFTGNIFIY